MQSYKMVTQTTTGGLQWEYDFEMASDATAIEYTLYHTAQFAGVRWFMSMLLFKKVEDWELVQEFGIRKPEAYAMTRRR